MDSVTRIIKARRVVLKIGSSLLVSRKTGELRAEWLRWLASEIAAFHASGKDVLIVSSGSIALGRSLLGLNPERLTLEQSQASAAVGQIRLARAYEEVLSPHRIIAAQILLTLEDSENRRRYLNSRSTLKTLLAERVIPVINENDTVATDEIRFGDNDRLAAQVSVMVGADLLVMLSDIDGFYRGDPRTDPRAERLDRITKITPDIQAMAGDAGTGLSKGGMKTKILAARTAMSAGCAMVIAKGQMDYPLSSIKAGAPCTWFIPQRDPRTARKRWINSMKPRGSIIIDDGAAVALGKGKSLLPAGVVDCSGSFRRGDPVEITMTDGASIGKGLTCYACGEVDAIKGRHSAEISHVLGYPGRANLIHRDDMALD